jgi:hypothetical protein
MPRPQASMKKIETLMQRVTLSKFRGAGLACLPTYRWLSISLPIPPGTKSRSCDWCLEILEVVNISINTLILTETWHTESRHLLRATPAVRHPARHCQPACHFRAIRSLSTQRAPQASRLEALRHCARVVVRQLLRGQTILSECFEFTVYNPNSSWAIPSTGKIRNQPATPSVTSVERARLFTKSRTKRTPDRSSHGRIC